MNSRPASSFRVTHTAAIGSVLVLAAFLLVAPSTSRITTAVNDLAQFAAAALASVACLRAARRSTAMRRSWILLAVGCFAWAVGQGIWTLYEVAFDREVPFPSPADVGFLLFPPLVLVALLPYVQTTATRLSRVRGVLEALIIAGGLFFISWAAVLSDILYGGIRNWAQAIAIAYPIGDLLILAVAMFAASRTQSRDRRGLALLSSGIAAIALSDSAFLYLTQTGRYAGSEWLDTGWVAGFLLIALAAAVRPTDRAHTIGRRTTTAILVAPFIPMTAAVALATAMTARGAALDSVLKYDAIAVICFVIAHQVAVAFENHTITATLEDRVASRTDELASAERHFRRLVEKSSDAIFVVDSSLRVREASAAIATVLGLSPGSASGRRIADLFPNRENDEMLTAIARAASGADRVLTVEWARFDDEGRRRYTQTTISNLLADDAIQGIVLNSRDVTEQKRLESELRHQAFHDPLTQLANRALFIDRAEHALVRSQRRAGSTAVLLIDLDEFKTVNDSLGHSAGDELLAIIAQRLRLNVRPGDTIARLGGDEFVILLEDVVGHDEVTNTVDRLLGVVQSPVMLDGRDHNVGASIGVAFCDDAAHTVEELLRNADTAMYVAKSNGKGRAVVFATEMYDKAVDRLNLQSELRLAIDRNALVLHFQPSIDLESGCIEGFEALVRWHHPIRGLLGPGVFIPLAEETGLIVPIGRWVLQHACRSAADWIASQPGAPPFVMAVNVSARQLEYGGLTEDVARALADSGLPPERLVLEITESTLVDDSDVIIARLHDLKALGVGIAIDDFGTGYASLSYLRKLPVDILKIDKTFVDDALGATEGAKFLRAILNLGQTLRLRTIAEGIEEDGQLETLRDAGCDVGQGYLFSKPLDGASAQDFLAVATVKRPLSPRSAHLPVAAV